MEKKKEEKKAFFVSKECHQKIKIMCVEEGQTISEWVEWIINKAYENRERSLERMKSWPKATEKEADAILKKGMGQSAHNNLPPGYYDSELEN